MKTMLKKTLTTLAFALGITTAFAVTPVATWTDFHNLTSGDYTWVNGGGTVNEDGSFTVGTGGLSMALTSGTIYTNRKLTMVIDAEVPVFADENTMFDLVVNGAHVSATSQGTTFYQRWNGAGDYGSTTWTPTMRRKIAIAFNGTASVSDRGTYTHFDGATKIFNQGLMSSSGNITALGVGCYDGSTKVATGMKIYGIELYDTNVTIYLPVIACNYDGRITGSGTTRPTISGSTANCLDTAYGQAAIIGSGSATYGSGWDYGSGGWTVTCAARLATASKKYVIWQTGSLTGGLVGLFVDNANSKIAFSYAKGEKSKTLATYTEICSLPLTADDLTAYHVYSVTFDNGTIRLVRDKDFEGAASAAYTATETVPSGSWQIGSTSGGLPSDVVRADNVMMDDIRLYQFKMTDDEIDTVSDELLPPILFEETDITVSEINAILGTQTGGTVMRFMAGTTITADEALAVSGLRVSCDGALSIVSSDSFKISEEEAAKYTFGYVAGHLDRSWERPSGQVISLNFISGSGAVADGTDYALAGDVPGSSWLSSTDASKTDFALSKGWDGAKNSETNLTGVTATWSCHGAYSENSFGNLSLRSPFMNGYLNDSDSKGVTITLNGVPYARYDVIIYRTLRGTSAFTPYTVTQEGADPVTYTCGADGIAVEGTANWGGGRQAKDPTWGKNAMRICGLTAKNVTLSTTVQTGGRCGTAAIQIVEDTRQDYTATISAAGSVKLSELDWSPKPFAPTAEGTATITVDPSVEGSVDIDCDVNGLTLASLAVVSPTTAPVSLTAQDGVTTTIGAFDFSQALGTAQIGLNIGSGSLAVGSDTVVTKSGSGAVTIPEGVTLTLIGGGVTRSKLTNAGTLKFQGGTAQEPIMVYNDVAGEGLGTVLLADETYVKCVETGADRLYDVTGVGAGSYFELTRGTAALGTKDGSTFRNLTFVSAPKGTAKFWVGGASLFDNTVQMVLKDGEFLLGVANCTNVVGSLSGDRSVTRYNGNETLEIDCTLERDYAGASTVPFIIGGTLEQTLSGNYTGALTINEGAKARLAGSARPASFVNNGTLGIDFAETYILPNDNDGTINLYGSDLIVMAGTKKGTIYTLGLGKVYDGFTVTINDCGSFTVPDGYDPENVRLVYPGGAPVNNPVVSGRTITFDWDVTDGASWWDFEFNGNLNNTGTLGKNMTAENKQSPYYNEGNTALWVGHQTPYLDLGSKTTAGYPEEFTAVIYGKMVNQANNFEIGFGSRDKNKTTSLVSVSLACGDPGANEVRLLIADNTTVLKTVSMTVPNAYTADHLYAFVCKTITENEAEKTKVIVYLDGIEWDSYTFDTKIVLGNGFQVGSVHGGELSGYHKATTSNDNAFLDFLRAYDVALNSEAMAKYAKKYPYKSTNGNASRTFDDALDQTWVAAPADDPWSVTPAEGETYATNIPPAQALLTIDATEDATVTMNLDEAATYEQLKVTSGSAITLKAGGTVVPTVSGLTSVGADLTVDYNAIGIGKLNVAGGKTLTFDFTGFPIEQVWTDTSYEVTGAVTLGEDAKVEAILPTSEGRTATFGLNEYGHYALTITVDTTIPFVYTIAEVEETGVWTWGKQLVDEATVLAMSKATIEKAGTGTQQFLGLSKFNYVVDEGTLMFTNGVDSVTSTITVNSDGTFDMNGKKDAKYNIVLNGGALVNNGDNLKTTQRQIDTLVLTANSTIGGTGNFDFIRNSHGATVLDLGGYTLTKTGSNDFWFDNGVVTNGTVIVNGGRFCVGVSSAEGEHKFVDATIEIGAEGTLYISNHDVTIGSITGVEGAVLDGNGGKLIGCTLKGNITLAANVKGLCDAEHPLTLDGTTLSLGQNRGQTIAGSGTVNAVLTDDEIAQEGPITIFTKAEGATTVGGTVVDKDGKPVPGSFTGGSFQVDHEAKIGTTYYLTLQDALNVGGDVTVLKDISLEKGLDIGDPEGYAKTVNLDLNAKTITAQYATTKKTYDPAINIISNAVVTIKGDGTIAGWTGSAAAALDGKSIIAVDGAQLYFENGTLTAGGEGSDGLYGICVKNDGLVRLGVEGMGGPAITTWFAAVGSNNLTPGDLGVTVTIYDGTYTQLADGTDKTWHYFCAPVYAPANGTYTIKGGTFSGALYSISAPYANAAQSIALDGGTFNQPLYASETQGAGEGTRLITKGETVELALADPETYCWAGNMAFAKIADCEAKVGDTYYLTLAGAFAAAKDGETIVVQKDCTVAERINIDPTKDITLDANGKTITIAEGIYAFVNGGATETTGEGTLTVTGNGTFYAPTADSTCFLWARRGNIVVESGSFSMDGTAQCVYADNGCKATINGGTFVNRTGSDVLNVHNSRSAVTDIQCFGGSYSRDPALGDDYLKGTFVAEGYVSTLNATTGLYDVTEQTGPQPAPGSPTEVDPVPGEENTYIVTPTGTATDLAVSGAKEGDTFIINGVSVTSLTLDNNDVTVTVMNGNGNVDITGAVYGWKEPKLTLKTSSANETYKFSTELDPEQVGLAVNGITVGANVDVAVTSFVGLTYTLVRSETIGGTEMVVTGSAQVAAETTTTLSDTDKPAGQAFYKVKVTK